MMHSNHEAEEHDVESLQSLRHDLGWTGSWRIFDRRAGTGLSTASIGSVVSHWSIRWIAKWSPGSRNPVETTIPLHVFSDPHTSFIEAILGPHLEPCKELKGARTWYTNFLEFKVREAWSTLFIPVLGDRFPAATQTSTPSSEDLSIAFQILHTIVGELGRENLALTDVVDKLYNNKMLEETDDERSHANQLVFSSFGWITCLYQAIHSPEPMKLQIIDPWPSASGSQRPHPRHLARRRALKNTTENFSLTLENKDQPLHTLLGRIIPHQHSVSGHLSPSSMASIRHVEECIELPLVCFHTLSKVVGINVDWVDSLSLHLEFDSSSKVLKVFRLPSLCLLMFRCEKVPPLSQLISDASEYDGYTSSQLEDAPEFHREVLLSYRLLFGQDAASCSGFMDLIRTSTLPILYQDPLLHILCGKDWEVPEARQVYDLIYAGDPSPRYSDSTHFPFLGKRILDIQSYVKGHNPNSFRSLWHDKRNSSSWYAFWAVLFFGCVTLLFTMVFGVIQTILAGYQVYYAKQQFLQQQHIPT